MLKIARIEGSQDRKGGEMKTLLHGTYEVRLSANGRGHFYKVVDWSSGEVFGAGPFADKQLAASAAHQFCEERQQSRYWLGGQRV